MTVSSVNGSGTPQTSTPAKNSMSSLGQADFLKLMIVQMQQQDPFNPVDQKEMLAQMAQFSSLAGVTETNETLQNISDKLENGTGDSETLKAIADKLDAILAAQKAAAANTSASGTSATL